MIPIVGVWIIKDPLYYGLGTKQWKHYLNSNKILVSLYSWWILMIFIIPKILPFNLNFSTILSPSCWGRTRILAWGRESIEGALGPAPLLVSRDSSLQWTSVDEIWQWVTIEPFYLKWKSGTLTDAWENTEEK